MGGRGKIVDLRTRQKKLRSLTDLGGTLGERITVVRESNQGRGS